MHFSIPPDLLRKPWTHEEKMRLIELAEKYDVLWNTTYPFYRELTQRKKALEDVKDALGCRHSVEDINSQWRNLKDVFYKKQSLMEQKEALGENPGEPVWRYYQPLKFLLSCEEERKNILRKRFHGNYELAQLRQLRLRRTQAISASENRNNTANVNNNNNNQLPDGHYVSNSVSFNSVKSRLKTENLEDFKKSCTFDRGNNTRKFVENNLNLDQNLSSSPPSLFSSSASFQLDNVKREIEDYEDNSGIEFSIGKNHNAVYNDNMTPETTSMSANDALLAAVSAASTSAETSTLLNDNLLLMDDIGMSKKKERPHYNGHYNENTKHVLMSRWRKHHQSLTTVSQQDNIFPIYSNKVNLNTQNSSVLRNLQSLNHIGDGEHFGDFKTDESQTNDTTFCKLHLRHCMLYEYNQKIKPTMAVKKICNVYGTKSVDEETCQRWFKLFNTGCLNLEDDQTSSVNSRSSSLGREDETLEMKKVLTCREQSNQHKEMECENNESILTASSSTTTKQTELQNISSSSKTGLSNKNDENSANKFKYFSMYVESALLDLNQQSPEIARRLVQEIYASVAKHQGQLVD